MTEIITVRFRESGRQYFFDPKGKQYTSGEAVIVDTSRGKEYGICILGNHMKEDKRISQPLREVYGAATEQDIQRVQNNKDRAQWAKRVCAEKIRQHKLDMQLVSAENSFEGNKMLFYFTADGRVDFRNLVRDLAATIHARIELRQIGVRDEAKMLGGLAICGRPYCCNQFLDKFMPVSIKMAKTQNLSLNPAKISGSCGRLMCCLKYEQDAYVDLLKTTPRNDSFVETPDGAGTIYLVNMLRQTVTVKLETDPLTPKKYHNSEIVVVRSGKGRRPEGYVQPPLAQLEKLRREGTKILQTKPQPNTLAYVLDSVLNPPAPTKQKKPKNNPQQKGQQNKNKPSAPKEHRPPTQGKGINKPKKRDSRYRPNSTRPNRNNKRGTAKNYSDIED